MAQEKSFEEYSYYRWSDVCESLDQMLGSEIENRFSVWQKQNLQVLLKEWEILNRFNIQVLFDVDPRFPKGFKDLESKPKLLFYKGQWRENQDSMAILGSRAATDETLTWMSRELPRFFAKVEVDIISGGARGVDQLASWSALRKGKKSFVYFPTSLDQLYPSEWLNMEAEFLKLGGVFVSQFPPGYGFHKSHFYSRNKLIVSHSSLVFIVQAQKKGGSLMSGRFAGEIGREVLTLPGSPWDQFFSGNLELIRCGALPITEAQDLISSFLLNPSISSDVLFF